MGNRVLAMDNLLWFGESRPSLPFVVILLFYYFVCFYFSGIYRSTLQEGFASTY